MQVEEIYHYLCLTFRSKVVVSLILNNAGNGYFYKYMEHDSIEYAPKKLSSEIIKSGSRKLFAIWKSKKAMKITFSKILYSPDISYWYPCFKNDYIDYWLKNERFGKLVLVLNDVIDFFDAKDNLAIHEKIIVGRIYSVKTIKFLVSKGALSGKMVNIFALMFGRPEYVIDYINVFDDCENGVLGQYMNNFY